MSIRKYIQPERGQSLVETAIILPVILFLIFAMLSICIYLYDKTVFLLAANKSLDTWIGYISNSDLTSEEKEEKAKDTAMDYLGVALFVSDEDVNITDDSSTGTLTVEVTGKYNFSLPLVSDILGKDSEFKAESSFIYGSE